MPADAVLFMFLKVKPPPSNPQYSVIPFFFPSANLNPPHRMQSCVIITKISIGPGEARFIEWKLIINLVTNLHYYRASLLSMVNSVPGRPWWVGCGEVEPLKGVKFGRIKVHQMKFLIIRSCSHTGRDYILARNKASGSCSHWCRPSATLSGIS